MFDIARILKLVAPKVDGNPSASSDAILCDRFCSEQKKRPDGRGNGQVMGRAAAYDHRA